MRAHAAVLRSPKLDWGQSGCPDWYPYDYSAADVREVPPTYYGGRKYSWSKPSARKGVTMANLTDLKNTFAGKIRKLRSGLLRFWLLWSMKRFE